MNVAELARLLPAHVARQRWFGAKNVEHPEFKINEVEELNPSFPGLARVVVETGGELYQLLLGLRPVDEADASSVGEAADVGVIDDAYCFDATVDPALDLILLARIAPDLEAANARPMSVEQSNTSVVYDERMILKVFRRLTGANPEIEVTVALDEQGFEHIARPLAVWRRGGHDLAVVQQFLAGGSEGWALALTSLRGLLDEGVDPDQSGGDMAPEAERLGDVTAELHLAMASAFGQTRGDADVWADAIEERFRSVHHPDLDEKAVHATLQRLRDLDDPGASIRVHGDYHLGQVMRTDDGWFVLDFEGEPIRPVEERRRPTSPMRDVAGMVRSFAYAAAVGVRNHGGEDVDDLAGAWERRNREAFLAAYRNRLDGTDLLPRDPEGVQVLLDAFELDKAVYEVAYEQAHRPDWVGIPLAAVRRLTSS